VCYYIYAIILSPQKTTLFCPYFHCTTCTVERVAQSNTEFKAYIPVGAAAAVVVVVVGRGVVVCVVVVGVVVVVVVVIVVVVVVVVGGEHAAHALGQVALTTSSSHNTVQGEPHVSTAVAKYAGQRARSSSSNNKVIICIIKKKMIITRFS
jgi:hypothetical protein